MKSSRVRPTQVDEVVVPQTPQGEVVEKRAAIPATAPMSESERTKVMVLGTDHLAHIEGGVPAGALTDLLGAIEAYPIEGVGLVARLAPDGSQSAGMGLMQPPSGPLIDMDAVERGDEKTKEAKDGKPDLDDPDVKELLRFQAMQFARIAVFAEEKSATIGLQDSQGRQRLLLQVDENDNPAIILYDAEGKETARFPEAKN